MLTHSSACFRHSPAGKMTRQGKGLAGRADDLSSIPQIHTVDEESQLLHVVHLHRHANNPLPSHTKQIHKVSIL